MSLPDLKHIRIDTVSSFYKFHTTVDVLRLDLIDPVISGNKWFKLREYLHEAISTGKKTILTYGGAFSNHIIATAAAANAFGLKSIGIIRGERAGDISHTLKEAVAYGMQLEFVSREDYKNKMLPASISVSHNAQDLYVINEGGYGAKGVEGAAQIAKLTDVSTYTHIIAAVGTGTMLAGLVEAVDEAEIIGVSVFKNNLSLQAEIESLLPSSKRKNFKLLHDYHFGGYAKYNSELVSFMNEWFEVTAIASDFVYTGKLFYAVNDLIQKNYFPQHSKLLLIQSGGLQGNRSLPKGTLIF
jgi:1-aminocyclopropane-1-carboxylate deaminase